MGKYRKKPVVIEAYQWTGDNTQEIINFVSLDGKLSAEGSDNAIPHLYIDTLEGRMTVTKNDWIIKGVQGEFYPCKPDIFEATYEEVEDADRS